MGKKKRKSFQKNQLLSLFNNENYKKVISKIKQFDIEGMSAEELHEIQLISYEKMAEANFALGDINRAMRDIESLLMIESSDEYRVIKLKYLCYMEHFKDAILFSKDLIDSKNVKIKKESMFLYLLANIYSGNYEIDKKNLKLLPIARQNYILAFRAFLEDKRDEALIFFNKCNPRAKVEKENINAIKSIILQEDSRLSNETIKPLYRFLINGDDTNLQNTKNSRVIKKEILSKFIKKKKKSDIENLISLESSIPIETIIVEIKEKEQQARLIFNNIVLIVEKQRNFTKALELFIKHRSSLIQFVESVFLLIQIKSSVDDIKSDKLLLNFFSSYLKLHHKRLSLFQLDFIFIFLLKSSQSNNIEKLIEEYGGEDILFLFKDILLMTKVELSDQDRFNNIMRRWSFLRDNGLDRLSGYFDIVNDNIYEMDKIDKESIGKQLSQISILFAGCEKAHKKYQPIVFELLSRMAKFVQNFEFSKNRELYIQLSEAINNFIKIYSIDKSDLSLDIKTLFISIEKKKSIKKEKKRENIDFFDIFKAMLDDYEDDRYIYEEEDLVEIKEEFIERLIKNENPFHDDLVELPYSCPADIFLELILYLLAKAIEFKRYDSSFTAQFLGFMNISMEDREYREQLIVSIKEYAKEDIKTAILFLYDSITLVLKKDRETLWYLKWLETYLYLIDDYNQPKDKAFKGILHHFIRVQQKKRFKTLNARFEKLIERFKDKGLL